MEYIRGYLVICCPTQMRAFTICSCSALWVLYGPSARLSLHCYFLPIRCSSEGLPAIWQISKFQHDSIRNLSSWGYSLASVSARALNMPMHMLCVNYSLKFTIGKITLIHDSKLTKVAVSVPNTNELLDWEMSFLPSTIKSLSGKGLSS